ncbi:SDR family NAD(P)-dependent oxidoreductase [Brooklawnia sp.]|uniref:SDR family NAD(P)-dependent oxidoreductase n=1 Tax=Brooklawnia sp. TaxID=2699740 RepID=UPI00311FE3DE
MDLGINGIGVLVTGASGGIGSTIARALAAEGAMVAVHYFRNQAKAEELATEIGGYAVRGDLSDPAEAASVIARAVAAIGKLDLCVANTGGWSDESLPIWEISPERFEHTIKENLTATFLTCREYLRHVRATGTGDIVLVSSISASIGEAGNSDYAAAKAALSFGFARTLKNEIVRIAPRGRVNVVAPGWTLTDRVSDMLDPESVQQATATRPLKRLSTPQDVAKVVVWLASPTASGMCTGQIVEVAGGMEGRIVDMADRTQATEQPESVHT